MKTQIASAINAWNGTYAMPRGTRKTLFDAGLIEFTTLWVATAKGRQAGLK